VTGVPPGGRALAVERTGPLVTVQDRGRPGWARSGVSRSGAADRRSLLRANLLVGNTSSAAGLEVLLGGLHVRATAHLVVAVSGAECPLAVDGRPVPRDAVLDLPPGARLCLGTATAGLRAYLAVRGGVAVPPELGSRSRDTLAALGPQPLVPGDTVPVGPSGPGAGPDVGGWPVLDVAPVGPLPGLQDVLTLRAVPGPRLDRLTSRAALALWRTRWAVATASDRVGVRLDGPPLDLDPEAAAGLPSEPLVRGAVQVPPGGQPVIFLADHPVTGGYPVAAVVLDADTDRLAQARPGRPVRFRRTGGPPPRAADGGTAGWEAWTQG